MSGVPGSLFFSLVHRDWSNDVRLYKVACRSMQVPRFVAWSFWTLGCRVGERRTGGKKYILKKFVNAWSPRHLFLQDHETAVVVSRTETMVSRRSINQRSWSEGWVVQRILYATDGQTGDRKVDRWNGCCSTQPHSVLGCGKVMVAHFAIF